MLLAFVAGLACGGRAAPAGADSLGDGVGGDDGQVYGGVIAASDAAVAYDATAAPPDPGSAPAAVGPAADDAADEVSDPDAGAGDDAAEDDACTSDLGPGDLLIDELMIESVLGAGDHGEWLEVTSTAACAVNLRGLHGECPHGAKAAVFDVAGDLWIPAGGSFVVADSVSPALDHDLPLPVIAWQGSPGDVLRNKGTTVTLSRSDVIIDTLTYPAMPLTVGTSLAFPADCDPAMRTDFSRWQPSQASWFPGFHGTPNAPNTDVACTM